MKLGLRSTNFDWAVGSNFRSPANHGQPLHPPLMLTLKCIVVDQDCKKLDPDTDPT